MLYNNAQDSAASKLSRPRRFQRLIPLASLILIVGSLLGSFLVFTTSTSTQAAEPAAKTDKQVQFGIHSGFEYVDFVKQGVRFQELDGAPALKYDDSGWPQADFQYIFMDERRNMPWRGPDFNGVQEDISGTYHLSFNGQATLSLLLADNPKALEFKNQVYNATTNTTTVDVVVKPNNWLLSIGFNNTKRDANAAVGSGITNVRFIRPGYPANTKKVFTDRYINTLKLLHPKTFRSFDSGINSYNIWNGTNLVTVKWSDRSLPTDPYWNLPSKNTGDKRGLGVPWEHYIQVCNAIGADCWINLPVSADDDYIIQLAKLFKEGNQFTAPLRKDLHLYVEYSNEVWNYGFSQSVYNQIQADAAGIDRLKQYTKRTIEVSKLFGQVYGQSAINNKIRPVLLWQYDNQTDTGNALSWATDYFKAPVKNFLYGIGEAPYLDPKERGRAPYPDPADPKSVDRVIDSMYETTGERRRAFAMWQTVATNYGLHQVGYESGPSLNAGVEGDASRSPRIAELIQQYFLNDYFAAGGDAVNFFAFGSGYPNAWGDWYTFESWSNIYHPKFVGALAVSGKTKPEIAIGSVLPWKTKSTVKIDASQYVASTFNHFQKPGTEITVSPGGGWTAPAHLDYLLRTSTDGTYELKLRGRSATTLQVEVRIDNALVGKVQAPETDGLSAAVSFKLKPGQHTLSLTPVGTGTITFATGAGIEIALTKGSGKAIKPSAPLNPYATVNDKAITLGWENVTTATKYTIKRGTRSGGPYKTVGTSTTNTYTDKVANDVTYYYVITASNSAGESIISPQVTATATQPVAPAAPVITGEAGGTDATFLSPGGQARITWPKVPNATSYSIKRSETTGTGYTTVVTQTSNFYYDRDLQNDKTYYFVVTALNSFGESLESNELALTPKIVKPDAPTKLTAKAGNGKVTLKWMQSKWQLPEFYALFHVKRGTSATGPFETVVNQSTNNFVDVGLKNGTKYCYVVSATNSAGESENSKAVCVTPKK